MPDEKPPRPPIAKVIEHPFAVRARTEHRMHLLADAGDSIVDEVIKLPEEHVTPQLLRALAHWRKVRERV